VLAALRRMLPAPTGQATAAQLMSPGVLTAAPDLPLLEAAKQMLSKQRKWLVVVDQEGKPLAFLVGDPKVPNPFVILVIAYAVRRLPYVVRSAVAGMQQTSVALEEAARSLARHGYPLSTNESIPGKPVYLIGFSGRGIVEDVERYNKILNWMEAHRRLSYLAILALAFIPNPLFDLAGIAAGSLKIPVGAFLFFTFIGKTLKMLALAYAGASSLNWLVK